MKTILIIVTLGSVFLGSKAWTQEAEMPDFIKYHSEQNPKSGLVDDNPQFLDYYVVGTDFDWDKKYRSQFVYNQAGEVLTETRLYEDGSSYRYSHEYNDQGLLLGITEEINTTEGWQMMRRSIMIYDNEKNPTRVINETYNSETGQWVLTDRLDYQNDYENSLLKGKTISRYNPSTASMVPENRYTYTYNERNLVFTEIMELYSTGSWTNSTRTEYHYQENSLATSEMLIDKWQENAWAKYMKYVLNYSENDNLDMLAYTWMSYLADYMLQYRMSWRYDSHGNQILNTFELLLNDVWNLMSGDQYLITYENNHAVERVHQKYSAGGGLKVGSPGWANYEKWEYSNFLNLGTGESLNEELKISCYPVPSADQVRIEVSSTSPGSGTLELTSITGQPIRKESVRFLPYSVTWDISNLPRGIYLLRLSGYSIAPIIRTIIKQ